MYELDELDMLIDDITDSLNNEGWMDSNLCYGMTIVNDVIYRMEIIPGLTFEPVEY